MEINIESDDDTDFIGFASPRQQAREEIDEAIALAKQLHVYKPGIEFVPGSKLEVLDARDNKWYLCKVVEVDWGELDILVHYDRWSIRFDEWLKMDSTRIRPAKTSSKENKKIFNIKEKILGYWPPDGKYYDGEIVKQLNEDCWSVLFYDGITKSLRSSHIKKHEYIEKNLPQSNEEPPKQTVKPKIKMEPANEKNIKVEVPLIDGNKSNIFDVKIMDEKRKSKRNPVVEKLFQSIRKRRRSERDDEEIMDEDRNPNKRFKDTKNVEPVDDHNSSLLKTSDDENSSYSEDETESDSDSSDSAQSSSNKVSVKKVSLINNKEDHASDSINIGAFVKSTKEDNVRFSPCKQKSPLSSSIEDLGFKGFESSSLSLDKYRIKETLSALLEIPVRNVTHQCPKEDCGKSFRKENLLCMHMKHYHPKLYKQDKGSVLNISLDPAHLDNCINDSILNRNVKKEQQIQIKTFTTDRSKATTNGTNLNEDSGALTDEKCNLNSIIKRRLNLRKHSLQETKLRKTRKSTVSECLNEVDVHDSSVLRYSKRKVPINVTLPKQTVEIEDEDILDNSLDKSDTVEKNDPDAIINCRCGFREEDGLMLQCDVCLCWQHGSCYHIENEEQVPNSYICSICENSRLQRTSMRFRHHQDWLKEGKLPRFSGSDGSNRLESLIRTCHELMGNVLSVSDVMHSLNLKLYISKKDDHPKLVMWHEKWKNQDGDFKSSLSTESGNGQTMGEIDTIRDKITRDNKEQFQNGIGPNQGIERFTGLRINGASSQQDSLNGVKMPIDKNDESVSYNGTSDSVCYNGIDDKKTLLEKHEIIKMDSANPNMIEVQNDEIIKKENKDNNSVCKDLDTEKSSVKKTDDYSDWKRVPLENGSKIKVEPQENSQELERSENEIKERRDSQDDQISDDQKEAIYEVFDFAIPGLVHEANVGPDLTDLLSSNAELERLVHQASTELAPIDNHPSPVLQRAPIIPQAERILPVKCKLNLLDHIDKMQNRLSDNFSLIEDQLQKLESEMGLTSKFSKEDELICNETSDSRDEISLQARALVRMSLRDLGTASKLINYRNS